MPINDARSRSWRRAALLLPLWAVFLTRLLTAATIASQIEDLGGGTFRYNLYPWDMKLLQYQEFDVEFDPSHYGGLMNGVAGSDFRLRLLQPDNPSGAAGHYSALALIDYPSVLEAFSVDVEWLGPGEPDEALHFLIHQFDSSGRIIRTIDPDAVATPEPAGWALTGAGLCLAIMNGFWRTVRRRD